MADKHELKPLVLVFKTEPEIYAVTGNQRQKLDLERAEKLNLKEEFLAATQSQSASKVKGTDTTCSITTDWDTKNGQDTITAVDHVTDDTGDGN